MINIKIKKLNKKRTTTETKHAGRCWHGLLHTAAS